MLARRRLPGQPGFWPALTGLALGLLALGPAVGPGYILSYDMVLGPRLPLSAATLGLAGGPPRAVPSDAVIAALSVVLPGDLVQKLILLAIVTASCAGAAALLRHCAARAGRAAPLAGQLAAGVCYAWNPYVAERLIMGHWALLLGYAALPWVVRAVLGAPRVRTGALAAALVPAAVGGFEAIGICALAAVPVALAARGGDGGGAAGRAARLAVTAAALLVASLPWLVPALAAGVRTDPDGALAFAARPDTPFGGLPSLLMLGGIWNAGAVPRGYGGPGAAAWLAVVAIALAAYVLLAWQPRLRPAFARSRAGGRPQAGSHPGGRPQAGLPAAASLDSGQAPCPAAAPGGTAPGGLCPGLGISAAAGLLIAAAGLTAAGRTALSHLIAAWPGFAVLRDGQQYLAPLALAESAGLGLAAARVTGLRGTAGARRAAAALAAMAVAASAALLPGLAWGAAGDLHATAYPADWLAARRLIDADPRPGSAVLLPWAAYRRPAWNGGTAVLDPWTKLLRRRLLWNDALQVGTRTVAAEDPAARRLAPAIAAPGPLTSRLRAAGVRYVIVDAGPLLRGGRCLAARARLPGATVVLASPDLVVFRLARNPAKGPACPAASR